MDLQFLDGTDSDFISELLDPEKYRGYLQVMSRFSSYSWRNIFLIIKQMPHASKLADFKSWKEQYGRTVIRGSTGIKIKTPVEQKSQKKLVEKIDPDTGTAILDENGKRIMEQIIIEVPVQFKLTSLMDISQTEGNPVPILAGDVMSDEALREVFDDTLKSMLSAAVVEPFDYYEIIRQIVHERITEYEDIGSDKADFISDSVVFVIGRRFGVEIVTVFANFISVDADMLEVIRKCSADLIISIEDRFAVACKERNFDPMTIFKIPEAEPPTEPKTKTTAESQTKPQYSTELRTEIIAGVEFNQYIVKPLTEETIKEENAPLLPPVQMPPAPQIKQPKPKEPFEPPILKHPPDISITIAERNQYGYTRPELLPLNKERAIALFRRDMTVYLLNKNNTEAMARYLYEIQNHDGIFGVAYGAWQNSREYIALASGNPEAIQEARFIHDSGDFFAVYQAEPKGSPVAYKSYEEIQEKGLAIDRHLYNLVYTAELPDPPSDTPEGIFMWVNAERPDDYKGRAVAVSDVLSIKKDGVINSHYANGRVFKELISFIGEEGRRLGRKNEEEVNRQLPTAEMEKSDIIKISDNTPVSVTRNDAQETMKPILTEIPNQPKPQAEQSTPPPIITVTTPQTEPTAVSPPSGAAPVQTAAPKPEIPPPALPVIRHELPVYRLSAKDADEHGAMDVYELNRRMDIDCAKVISEAIQAHKKGENSYDLITPAESLLEIYGAERMMWVLSKHILTLPKNFKEVNYSWAKTFLEDGTGSGDENPAFFITIHHAVLDAFINELRVILSKKTSFSQKMKDAKRKSEAHNKLK